MAFNFCMCLINQNMNVKISHILFITLYQIMNVNKSQNISHPHPHHRKPWVIVSLHSMELNETTTRGLQ